MDKKEFSLNGKNLTLDHVFQVAHASDEGVRITVDEDSKKKMRASRNFVEEIVKKGKAVYGINTGFGALSSKQIPNDQLGQLQINLIRSHCTGMGRPYSRAITRAILLLRANCLMSGFSGMNPDIVDLILEFIYFGIHPVIPEKGSVGASGDLAPLAHLALALIGEGEVEYKGKTVSSEEVMKKVGLRPLKLGPKDGLSLINGTAVMTALGSMALNDAIDLIKLSDVVGALTLEAIRGSDNPFLSEIWSVKPHAGQRKTSENLVRLLGQSEIRDSHMDCGRVQDPYSLRCMPQIHGACRQTVEHSREIFETELNSVTDNPLVFVESGKVLSGGNFHGEPLAMAMDYLAIGMAELCNISERRIEKLINPVFSELPAFLTKNSGLNSGLMIAHVTVAALASENKYLCHPASVDSIPTSTDKEDHVSMGVTSGLKLQTVIENLKHCLAVEILCNTQALEFLKPLKSSPPLQAVYDLVRTVVPPIEEDRVFYKDIDKIKGLIESKAILNQVEKIIGKLQ